MSSFVIVKINDFDNFLELMEFYTLTAFGRHISSYQINKTGRMPEEFIRVPALEI
jgi:hypothetical protein